MEKALLQKLLSGGLWVLLGKVLSLFSGLILISILTRLLSQDDMGLYFLIFSLVNFGLLFSLLGMDRSIVRIISEAVALEQYGKIKSAIRNVLQIGITASLMLSLLLLTGIGGMISESLFRSRQLKDILYLPAIWICLLTLQTLITEAFRGLNDIRFATLFGGVLPNLINAGVLGAILFWYKNVDISVVLYVMIGAFTANIFIAFLSLKGITRKFSDNSQEHISKKGIIQNSWSLYITFMFLSGLQHGHFWILGYFSSKESVAIFGTVLRLIILLTAALEIVRLVIPPLIGQLYTRKDYAQVETVLRTTATLAGLPSVVGILLIIFFGKSALFYLYGSAYTAGYNALVVMSMAHLINVFAGTPGILLIMASKEKIILGFAMISGVIAISVSLLLVQKLDYLGVSFGAAFGIASQSIFMALYCKRALKIKTFMSASSILNTVHHIRPLLVALSRS